MPPDAPVLDVQFSGVINIDNTHKKEQQSDTSISNQLFAGMPVAEIDPASESVASPVKPLEAESQTDALEAAEAYPEQSSQSGQSSISQVTAPETRQFSIASELVETLHAANAPRLRTGWYPLYPSRMAVVPPLCPCRNVMSWPAR
jgi:hypothetical protein